MTSESAPVPDDLAPLAERAVELVHRWLDEAAADERRDERADRERLAGVVADEGGVRFAMRFVDRVVRPESNRVAAEELVALVDGEALPSFLSPADKALLRTGAKLAPILPGVVIPLAKRRMRTLVGNLVIDADADAMRRHLERRRDEGYRLNVNLLGEAVLGEQEAARRHGEAMRLLGTPSVDYVSVKDSAIVPQLNEWDFDGCVERIAASLRPLFVRAASTEPPTFVNLDMEEYRDLDLTLTTFMRLLDEPELHHVDAGIVLQAYLPDSFDALQRLVAWANERGARTVDGRPGGTVKVRLVKGANLAMERVEAAMHGWEPATYATKAETDANYKRCVDWLFRPGRLTAVQVGLASHNLFDIAFAHLLAADRGVTERIEFEMLEGMAPTHARHLNTPDSPVLLYTPVVRPDDFDVAISYLFRRLEENATDENFIHHLFGASTDHDLRVGEADKFRAAVRDRWTVGSAPRRTQDRRHDVLSIDPDAPFANEPDTDPALPANREWIRDVVSRQVGGPTTGMTTSTEEVDRVVAAARSASTRWSATSPAERRSVLHRAAEELARRRGDLIAAMVREGRKTVGQADPEVSEAIDFARYYGDRALELTPDREHAAVFEPLGVIAVVPPWNFPVAIPAGGVLASLAAGNAVIFKPAPETPRCAEIVAECCWAAGVPNDALQFVRVPDDEVGRHLVSHADIDAVILTGAYDTAELFRSWRPDLRIFAETSGKNSLVITPHADLDLAVADLVASAFGHAGQKCSAASLGILVGPVAESERFRRQLIDATSGLEVGPPDDLAVTMGPTIVEPIGKLLRGLTRLEPGESWLVEPRRIDVGLWSPGIRDGVAPGSWFHMTECFGPVLGLMRAETLDEAIELQNAVDYGLTGGIHSLDPNEIDEWVDRVQVGNAYVNRVTTGAIVRRQPFGGWKHSSVGPGAKAGGPNYVAQLGRWRDGDDAAAMLADDPDAWLTAAIASDAQAWADEFGVGHDPSQVHGESNVFRYRPLPCVAVRVEAGTHDAVVRRVGRAAARCGVRVMWSNAVNESQAAFAARLGELVERGVTRVRVLGEAGDELRSAALRQRGVHLADDAVTADGRRELLHYLREQAVSRTMHRYGNLL